jgi:hypothetical protein
MNMLGAVLRELAGLFVDDGSLTLEIVVVVVLAATSAALIPDVPLAAILLVWSALSHPAPTRPSHINSGLFCRTKFS